MEFQFDNLRGNFWFSAKHMAHHTKCEEAMPLDACDPDCHDPKPHHGYNVCIVDGKEYPYSNWDSRCTQTKENTPLLTNFDDYVLIGYGEYHHFVKQTKEEAFSMWVHSAPLV
jgi:hypothetical protein